LACKSNLEPSRLLLALSDIKLAHSVFALPFALLAAFLATPAFLPATDAPGYPPPEPGSPVAPFLLQLLLILLCMFFARTWAMLVNRLADVRFDAENPRTARRVFASGRLDVRSGWMVALASAGAFQIAAAGFGAFFANWWPAVLAVPVLGWIALYSYTNRFTALCHLFLGGALAASPVAAVIAIDPSLLHLPDLAGTDFASGAPPGLAPPAACTLFLFGFVLFWVAGFDVAYALADIEFDRRTGLRSIPARLGARGALWTARLLHAIAFVLLVLAWRAEPRLGLWTLAAVLLVGGLLVFEHVVLQRRGVAGLPLAFFTINGIVSLTLGAAGIADVILG